MSQNFRQGFYYYIIHNQNNNINTSENTFKLLSLDFKQINKQNPLYSETLMKELEDFFNYQFIFLVYDKYMKISKEKENSIEFFIEEIYDKLIEKYIYIFIQKKRSFLTEVAEGDNSLGYINILLLLMNIKNSDDASSGEKIIEFSDGYKSCYTLIKSNDPINKLLNQMILHNWMNVEIGMSKVLTITEDFKITIKIYYNSLSPSNEVNYGSLIDKNKFLTRNILELRNDGGEISLINVIIIKKYDYYINNITKKQRYSRKKHQNESIKITESSDKKYYKNENSSDEKDYNNHNNIKEPDVLLFHYQAIAMDYDIYQNMKKKNEKSEKNIEQMLKKRYTIDFCVRNESLHENIEEGKMYKLMFLNLENNKNNPNNNTNMSNKKYYKNFQENNIIIKFSDKSQINEISLNANVKKEKEYIDAIDKINKSLNLTNNIDIGKFFVESEEKKTPFNNIDYQNKEFCITGLYSGYIDKRRTNLSSENNVLNSNDSNDNYNSEEYVERFILLSIGQEKIAIIKLHREDFFYIDVNSNIIKDKLFNFSDVIFKEILYIDNDNDQPKLTGRKKMENDIPILNLETTNYTTINYNSINNKNKEHLDLLIKHEIENKKLSDTICQIIP